MHAMYIKDQTNPDPTQRKMENDPAGIKRFEMLQLHKQKVLFSIREIWNPSIPS
jgi:hypothetical protein